VVREAVRPDGRGRWLTALVVAALLLHVGAGSAAAPSPLPATILRIKPSIVAVGSFHRLRSPQFSFAGTGFVVADGTVVATNEHVVAKLASSDSGAALVVALPAGGKVQVRPARKLASDASTDLALLKIGGAPLPALVLGRSEAVREGEIYLLTGFPIGAVLGLYPVTHRVMIAAISPIAIPSRRANQLDARSARRLAAGPYPIFQLDATAYPGNSGSPIYHPESGEVVGIVNSVLVKSTRESALTQPSGITYAIPVRKLKELLDQTQ
jgi:S1-C subfamily serine protease